MDTAPVLKIAQHLGSCELMVDLGTTGPWWSEIAGLQGEVKPDTAWPERTVNRASSPVPSVVA